MSCRYCNGSNSQLFIDNVATCDDLFVVEAWLEGCDEAYPALTINADGAFVSVRIKCCPMCGRKLGEDAEYE